MPGKEDNESSGRLSDALNPLNSLQRLLRGPIGDIRDMAESVRVLPDLAKILARIRDETVELNEEVQKMRQSVNRIEDEIGEVKQVISPWRRARARFSRKDSEEPAPEDGTA